ncbi:MAG: MFS transporter [Clostridia bacterium]|nr:MFS transporter [Clostridia bacterium]MBQ8504902.1 MFS transporter [Clostridia bacterium]MBQ8772113.1 MFS transporter [Clostridia bacterium]
MNNNEIGNKKQGTVGWKFWLMVLGMGLAGQLCWNIENQWFTTFVYAKISKDVNIVSGMVILSAFVTTVSTFLFGTLSDRYGKRKMFVSYGYIIWGIATILFGLTEYVNVKAEHIFWLAALVVLSDAVMSFFGSMGYDSGYNVWLNDYTNDKNKGQVGAALAALPVLGTIVGTVLGGVIVGIGNPTAAPGYTGQYDTSLDNYQLLFWSMGIFVIALGVISLFVMKDHPSLTPNKRGTFWQQFVEAFDFKKLKGNENNKEMLLANLVICAFFIPFNFYFTHLGNWIIYDIGFSSGDMGLIEGIGLIFAVLVTLPFIKVINKNKIPLVVLLAIMLNALGLILIFLFVKDSSSVDTTNLFAAKNLPLFLCVFLVGTGYVLIMQTGMIWVRGLFPEESKGQFEGIRVLFFVLIPMLIGTLIGNVIIENTEQPSGILPDNYGHIPDIPQENLFLYASIMVLVALVPLYFANKAYKARIAKQMAAEQTPAVVEE